jgi:hypothetical protein
VIFVVENFVFTESIREYTRDFRNVLSLRLAGEGKGDAEAFWLVVW